MRKERKKKKEFDLWGILFYIFGVVSGTAIIMILKAGGIL